MSDDSTTQPLVSIITLNFNGLGDTQTCLRSQRKDGCQDREIIVWDNGSDNNEAEKLQEEFSDMATVIAHPENIGVAPGYNAAARHARGKYLIFLNNDTEVAPGWLDVLVDYVEKNPDTAACQPKVHSFFDRDSFDYAGASGGFIDFLGYPFMRGRLFFTVEKDEAQYDEATEIQWASAVCMLIRRDLWWEVGGADERLFMYMDEIDVCWQLRRKGHKIVVLPDSLIYHKGAQSLKHARFKKRFLEHRNSLLVFLKNASPLQMLALPLRLVLECVSFFYYLAIGRTPQAMAVVASFFSFLSLAPWYLAKRSWRGSMPLLTSSIVWSYFIGGVRSFDRLPGIVSLLRRLDQE